MNQNLSPVVAQYFAQKALSELGYRFDPDLLEDWEAEAFMVISNKLNDLREKEMKRGRH